jgi:hypothetical protein
MGGAESVGDGDFFLLFSFFSHFSFRHCLSKIELLRSDLEIERVAMHACMHGWHCQWCCRQAGRQAGRQTGMVTGVVEIVVGVGAN